MLIKPLFIRLFGSTLYAYSTKGSGSISPTVVRRVSSFEASAFEAFTGGVAGADVGEPFRFAEPGIFAHLGPEATRDRRELALQGAADAELAEAAFKFRSDRRSS